MGDFANDRMKEIRADTTLSDTEKLAALQRWDEGGVYRVAAHTALGALGTGSVEGALTTGGVAVAAPTLDKVQDNLAKALIDSGMSESIAKGTASGVVSLALLGAGSAAGLDTSSTVTATNVDANNRQLHPEKGEYWVVDQLYKAQGNKKKWTREQIANALRSADFKKGGFAEDDDSNTVVNLINGEPKNYVDYKIGAKWKSTGGGLILPVDRNIDPVLGAWIRQVMSQDQDFKSYNYKWDSQNLKGNKPLPSIVTPEKPKEKVKPKPVYQGSNPAKVIPKIQFEKESESRNQAVKNGADLRDGKSIEAVSNATANKYVTPTIQAGFGVAEVAGGAVLTTTCATGIGCVAAGAVIANGLDNIATGATNFGGKPSQQVPSKTLDTIGVSKENAAIIKIGTDIASGGILAVGAKPALTATRPKSTVNSAASKADNPRPSVFDNYESDKPTVLDYQDKSLTERAQFLSDNVAGLTPEQAEIILKRGQKRETSIVIGGSRVRGDHTDSSDIDIGFGNLSKSQTQRIFNEITGDSQNLEGGLRLERTKICPGNCPPSMSDPIKSPEEFFQREGIRADRDDKAGQPYKPSGSISRSLAKVPVH